MPGSLFALGLIEATVKRGNGPSIADAVCAPASPAISKSATTQQPRGQRTAPSYTDPERVSPDPASHRVVARQADPPSRARLRPRLLPPFVSTPNRPLVQAQAAVVLHRLLLAPDHALHSHEPHRFAMHAGCPVHDAAVSRA